MKSVPFDFLTYLSLVVERYCSVMQIKFICNEEEALCLQLCVCVFCRKYSYSYDVYDSV